MKATIFECFKTAKNFLIVGHYHPDGDAIGSALALSLGLKQLGKEVTVYNRDPVPFNLNFLPVVDQLTTIFPQKKFDVAVMVDCAQPKRVSDDFAKAIEAGKYGKLICIDHHLLDKSVGDIDWIEPNAASTGCVIWHILKNLETDLTQEMANLVYCTLTVDTGSFRYSNTTDTVFEMAAELVSLGADPWFVAQHLEESNPIERYLLLGESLKSLKVGLGGKYASMEVTQKMLKSSGAHEDLSDEFASIPRSIQGVEVAALFREISGGKIKVSLRSKESIDVAKIAKSFKGGGHEHAAGCNFELSLKEAKKKIEEAVQKSLEK